jgi:two-component sensor histidine kinase
MRLTPVCANIFVEMTSIPDVGVRDLLDALCEPAVVLDTGARIHVANRAAAMCFGPMSGDQVLTDLTPETNGADLRAYLVRCSGSRGPLPGAVALRKASGTVTRFRCSGGLLTRPGSGGPALVLLRLYDAADERFSALAQKVRDLNAEVRKRRRTQAVLEESLRDREILLRELHHRVKNSIQMLGGMLAVARREAGAPETRAILNEAARRLAAVGAVHQMLYRTDQIDSLQGDQFVENLSRSALRSFGAEARLSVKGTAEAQIPNDVAMPLALILNELLTNAVKYGAPDGSIRVGLTGRGGVFELSVANSGATFDPAASSKRASGLGLVRGLTRQLGGSFVVERGNDGPRCIVRFEMSRHELIERGVKS